MGDQEVKIKITTDATGVFTGINGVQTSLKKMSNDSQGLIANIKTHWLGFSAAIYGAKASFDTAWNLAETAAQFEGMKAGLQGLSAQYGMTADSAIAMAKEAVAGQLSMKEAGELATKAFALGFNPDQVKEFLTQAGKLTDVMGGTIPEAFSAMERAAATGRKGGLVGIGINIDLKKTILDYANAHGIAVTSVSSHNAMQVRAQAIMAAAKQITDQTGESVQTTAQKMNVMRATVADLNLLLGQGTIRAASGLVGIFQVTAAACLMLVAAFARVGQGYNNVMGLLTFGEESKKKYSIADNLKADAEAAVAASEDLAQKAKKNFGVMISTTAELGKSLKKIKPIIEENGTEMSKQANARLAAERIIYKDLSGYSTAYYEVEKKLIEDQADKYRKLGVDKVAVAAWVTAETQKLQIQQAQSGDDLIAGMKAGWQEWVRTQATTGKEGFDLMQNSLKAVSSALTEFVKTGKMDFKSLADVIITEIIRIQIQSAMKGIGDFNWAGLIGKGVSAIGSMFGGTTPGGTTPGDGIPVLPEVGTDMYASGVCHSGGIVGSDYAPTRSLPISVWSNAPRFHSGLKPDEFPSILQKGEGVFTKGQMKALGGGNNEPSTTTNNFFITANDAKSFDDMCRRNPSSIVGPVMNSLKDNKTRTDMKGLLK